MKFKEGTKVRHITHHKVLEVFSIDFETDMYIVTTGVYLIAVKIESLDEWYEELLPVEQELW